MFVASSAVYCALSLGAESASEQAVASVHDSLSKSEFVTMYFLTRTGSYSYDTEMFKQEASIVIKRKCGNNCAEFLARVLEHLRESTPIVDCQPGQQSALIETENGDQIVYSYFGQQIKYGALCFFSERRFDSIVKNAEFLFR
jgi:hypothetical protein